MLAYTLRLVRCWRLVTLNDALHDHVDTFFSVIPVFAQTLSFALIVAYAFAMVAMQLFADKVRRACVEGGGSTPEYCIPRCAEWHR